MIESRTLARETEIKARAWRGKSGLHGEGRQIPRRKGRANKESLPSKSKRKHERVVDAKALQEDLQSLAKSEIGKKVGRRRARL